MPENRREDEREPEEEKKAEAGMVRQRESRQRGRGSAPKWGGGLHVPRLSLISSPWGTEAEKIACLQLLWNSAAPTFLHRLLAASVKSHHVLWKVRRRCENTLWYMTCLKRPGTSFANSLMQRHSGRTHTCFSWLSFHSGYLILFYRSTPTEGSYCAAPTDAALAGYTCS